MSNMKSIHTNIIENLDDLDNQEIRHLINEGIIKEDDVVHFFNNLRWEDQP